MGKTTEFQFGDPDLVPGVGLNPCNGIGAIQNSHFSFSQACCPITDKTPMKGPEFLPSLILGGIKFSQYLNFTLDYRKNSYLMRTYYFTLAPNSYLFFIMVLEVSLKKRFTLFHRLPVK